MSEHNTALPPITPEAARDALVLKLTEQLIPVRAPSQVPLIDTYAFVNWCADMMILAAQRDARIASLERRVERSSGINRGARLFHPRDRSQTAY